MAIKRKKEIDKTTIFTTIYHLIAAVVIATYLIKKSVIWQKYKYPEKHLCQSLWSLLIVFLQIYYQSFKGHKNEIGLRLGQIFAGYYSQSGDYSTRESVKWSTIKIK